MGGQNHEIETKAAIPRDWLTIEEAADYYQIKPKTVRKWLYQRKLRYYKIGGLVRIRKEDLETFPVLFPTLDEIIENGDNNG